MAHPGVEPRRFQHPTKPIPSLSSLAASTGTAGRARSSCWGQGCRVGISRWQLLILPSCPAPLSCARMPGWSRAPELATGRLSRSFPRAEITCPEPKAAQKELQEVCCSPSPWNKPHWLPNPRLCCYSHPQSGSPALSTGCDTSCSFDSLNP